jgi:hypothetical protein
VPGIHVFPTTRKKDVDGRDEPGHDIPSRQLALAAKPDPVLRFHLRHLEQTHQHAEPVTPRYPRKVGGSFGNEGRGLIRPAIPQRIVGSRTPVPARGWACSPAPCLGQKIASNGCLMRKCAF